jgi:tetratricopeptide (TPR) repeat protein
MKKKFHILILLSVLTVNGHGQQNRPTTAKDWQIQAIPVQSRWARQVTPENVWKEYPRPHMVRKHWQNLNGLWEYAITPKDAPPPTEFQGKILVPFPLESALSGVQKTLKSDQHLWYKRYLQKPELKTSERLLLHLGAVDWQATIIVNDKEVGQHTGGYQSFSFDITDYLKAGLNTLMIKVYDPTDNGPNPHGKQTLHPQNIYYTASSGIWQTVWLEKVPTIYISGIKITPDIDRGMLQVTVNTPTTNDDLIVTLAAKANGKIVSTSKGKTGSKLLLSIKNARLWSPDDPFLYDLSVQIMQDKRTIDQIDSYFGMRKIEIKRDEKGVERIFLNNKYTYNLGTLDQGFWPDGLMTAPTDEALAFDIKAIKAMGFNTIRKHIKIEPERWYYHADKTGLLVWQDFVNPPHALPEGAREVFEKEIKETLDQLRHHPSIIVWVLFNEGWGAYDQQRLTEWVKLYDSTRLVNGHSGELLYVDGKLRSPSETPWVSSDLTDVHSYPDPTNVPAQPGKARVLGEFGGVGVAVPGHQWNDVKGWGYVQVHPKELIGKYEIMMKRLKKLEAEGLSGSIYTQPFDVEGEENGLLTYDREVIKIPLDRLRTIHSPLVKHTMGSTLPPGFAIAKNIDLHDTDDRYPEFMQDYENGNRDSARLRRLALMAIRKKDQPVATKIGADYIRQLQEPFSKQNLDFIMETTRTSKDKGFELIYTQKEKINAVLGKGSAERKLKSVISSEEIAPHTTDKKMEPDWDSIENRIARKYGELGKELAWGHAMVYYATKKDWQKFAKYYVLYYEKALTHSDYHINNMSWYIFEHVDAPAILNFAVKVAKFNVETFDKNDPYAIDTYANLLYKTGNSQEAIEWQERAAKLSNNEETFTKTLEKMKKGEPTWPSNSDNNGN